ncbi:hypothetical protein [Arthrobacter methylotrophus]|uniref:hypothetical protein n=1 Tax=Arthrobacter methylotrophus TaxID=121291 RepID=UPI0031ED29D6
MLPAVAQTWVGQNLPTVVQAPQGSTATLKWTYTNDGTTSETPQRAEVSPSTLRRAPLSLPRTLFPAQTRSRRRMPWAGQHLRQRRLDRLSFVTAVRREALLDSVPSGVPAGGHTSPDTGRRETTA